MAEAKKPEKKPEEKAPTGTGDPFVDVVWAILVLLVVVYLINGFLSVLTSGRIIPKWDGGGYTTATPLSSSPSAKEGDTVETSDETVLYSSPGGVEKGVVKKGTRGFIIDGPVSIMGTKYWHIQFTNGTSGWVKEKDLLHIQTDTSLVGQAKRIFFNFFNYFKYFSVILSAGLILLLHYLYKKLKELGEMEEQKYYPKENTEIEAVNPQWQRVLAHAHSGNESDWRLSILEADIMLGDLLDKLSLPGDTIGDKLKAVEKSDFTTVENAWEAHKIRNRIAHDGVSFLLSAHETKRIIGLYKEIFEEFRII
ncbi:MAG: hypothetical protein V4690_03860 [Patescibacteria group bacterium]